MADIDRALLKEAYIDPIRFALLVDDEFPAYGSVVEPEARVRSMINLCRGNGWLCDVENDIEKIIDLETNKHLHQSDLLIVDFHLDNARADDCTAAILLLQRLAVSPHFNMAVIYTSETPSNVALNVAFGLGGGWLPPENKKDELSDMIDDGIEGLDLEPDITVLKGMMGSPGGVEAAAATEKQYRVKLRALGKPMLGSIAERYFSTRMRGEAITGRPSDLLLSCDVDSAVPWVSTPNLFVAVVSKEDPPEVLLEKLCDGLEASKPTPLQVMVVQARAALEKAGSRHDRSILSRPVTQAGWLLNVLAEAPPDRAARIGELYGHLFASLAAEIHTAAGVFGAKVIGDGGPDDAVAAARALSRLDEGVPDGHIYHAANEFLSSGPAEPRGRLTPGLIFQATTGRGNSQLWVCTTPSCDLVPGQNEGGWDGQLGPYKAVYAARLAKISAAELDDRLRQAPNGRHIYLTVDGEPLAYEVADDIKRQAKLEVMFVGGEGRYEHGTFQGFLVRERAGRPDFVPTDFTVLAKLRPGYANKFLMDAGVQKARIGLGWLRMPGVATAEILPELVAASPAVAE